LGALWKDFEADRREPSRGDGGVSNRLTQHGFSVYAPVFSAEGRLFYAVATPHEFPAVMELPRPAARVPAAAPRHLTTKYLGGHLSASGGLIVFDQLEVTSNVALFGDLYAVPQDGGAVRRLTRGARAADPDVSPDGTTIICTTQSADRRSLAMLAMPKSGAPGQPLDVISEPETDFSSPRWSPDGRTIVVERRRRGGPAEIVVVEVSTTATRVIVSSSEARNVGPVWTKDGSRVLFASNRGGAPFAIYDVDVASGAMRRLDGTGATAQAPALSPDGGTLVYVGYTVDGSDLFSIPMASARWTDVPLAASSSLAAAAPDGASVADTEPGSEPYRPWRTLAPRFWEPLVASDNGEITAGAGTAAADALGRHSYAATAAWSGSRLRPDWTVAYAYDRWWPTLFGALSDDTDPWRAGRSRTRELNAGAVFPIRRVRWAQSVLAELNGTREAFDCPSCTPAIEALVDRRSIRLGWSFDNARSYGYSISRESGGSIRVTSESTRQALGSNGNASATTLDARLYVPVVPRHAVVATRLAMATASGAGALRRSFSAAGAGPQPGGFRFGTDAIGLLRGIDEDAVTGPHVMVGSLDYRFPILDVQRGAGTLPVFLRRIHGALFVDAGTAWTQSVRWSDVRRSFGGELSVDTVLGYSLPLTFSGGAAWRDDPVAARRGVVTFGRIGRAF
ncbi:MAG: BamA/TamA family outer membrane protein, partial [Acidobacteriota bacterium]